MEKIKKALELAGRNRLDKVVDLPPESNPAYESPLIDEPPAEQIIPRPPVEDTMSAPLRFTQTRVVEVPASTFAANRIVAAGPDSDAAHAFDLLSARVSGKLRENGWRSLAVVSPGPDEGKTLTALNLGVALAKNEERTALVVDMDFRRPSVASYLGLAPAHGYEHVLGAQASLEDVLVSPGIDRFAVLPAAGPANNAGSLVDSSRARQLAAELKGRYHNRVVLFDLPPLLAYGDAHSFLENVDAVLLVVADGITKDEQLDESLKMLGRFNLLGTVLNRTATAPAGYR